MPFRLTVFSVRPPVGGVTVCVSDVKSWFVMAICVPERVAAYAALPSMAARRPSAMVSLVAEAPVVNSKLWLPMLMT
jgi:hypothetical protein